MKQTFKCHLEYAKGLAHFGRFTGYGYYAAAWFLICIFASVAIVETGYKRWILVLFTLLSLLLARLPVVRARISKLVIDGDILYARTGLFHSWKISISSIEEIGYRAEAPLSTVGPQRLMQNQTQRNDYRYDDTIIFSGYVFTSGGQTFKFPFDIYNFDQFLDSLRVKNVAIKHANELPKIGVENEKKRVKIINIMFWVFIVLLIPLFFAVFILTIVIFKV